MALPAHLAHLEAFIDLIVDGLVREVEQIYSQEENAAGGKPAAIKTTTNPNHEVRNHAEHTSCDSRTANP